MTERGTEVYRHHWLRLSFPWTRPYSEQLVLIAARAGAVSNG